jgi:drug/metabolite transporter (DMT)-like permease
MSPTIPLIASVALGAVAQISLRHGMAAPKRPATGGWPISPWVALWGLCFAAATVLWLLALRHADISYAYPMLGTGYILVTLLASWLLHERISARRWIAVLVITAGVVMVGVNR